jgi:DNA polymerase-2
MNSVSCRGFLVHAYADLRRDRLYLTGRLEDGRSFAAMESRWRPCFHVYEKDIPRCAALFTALKYEVTPSPLEAFSGTETLSRIAFNRYADRSAALKLLEGSGIPSPDGDMKPPEAFLTEQFIRGPITISGTSRPGRRVDLVFSDPEMVPPDAGERRGYIPLRIASIDIETDTGDGSIRAIAVAYTDAAALADGLPDTASGGESVSGSITADENSNTVDENGNTVLTKTWNHPCVRVLSPAAVSANQKPIAASPAGGSLIFHTDERSLIAAFIADIQAADPDVLTGWNFLDFDFPRIAERCERLGIPFALGRSREEAKFFAGDTTGGRGYRRRSAAALVPGRQVIDALRIVRSGPRQIPTGTFLSSGSDGVTSGFTLEAVSQAVLGEGKMVAAAGTDKIAELDRLYAEDPVTFGQYCYKDAALVLRILKKTGLFRLTMERASLTGVFLDKAWTSVVSFERIYGMELRRKNIAPPPPADVTVSGAAGGTVLDPLPGFFSNIAVFDFRSLYPTIMRTFNIDPLAHARLPPPTETLRSVIEAAEPLPPIVAPNGAAFSREPGVLPALIGSYFAERRKALDAGDDTAAHVYKILMNSFYGVLGTGSCRYGRTELAGSITGFARKWLYFSRDWFTAKGFPVLYGDTDSLFVETGLGDGAAYGDFLAQCGALAGELNRVLTGRIREEYQLESFIELRFEKVYRRLLIPPLRGLHDGGEARGRAKGYGGYILSEDGGTTVEVKGMEAVRSDATPLARRVQLELLELVFSGGGEQDLKDTVLEVLKKLRAGKLDDELTYRKRLSRPPETYTASTPPQVKAARALGWKGRRGTVEFVWTVNGPEPVSIPHARLDYDHYTDSQVLPVAQSIAAALGWNTEIFPQKGRNREALENGQMELGL